jgi:transposase-like protein
MPISDSAATELAQLLGSGTAGELIPELVRHGLQALIEAEAAAALGADRHQRTAEGNSRHIDTFFREFIGVQDKLG